MLLNHPVIDLHTHLRNNIPDHTRIAGENGIDLVVYMANTDPVLDSKEKIISSLQQKRNCVALPISAITKNLAGEELVEIDKIRDFVVGFSDDGKYLADLELLKIILSHNVLVLAHCSPDYETGLKNPESENLYIENYLEILEKNGGKLHIQHVSKKSSIESIRSAKKKGLGITCETCPHYFTFTADDLEVKANPPLGNFEDIQAVREGLADGTIDVIASDYAPKPRETGIAGFSSFIPLSYGLVLQGILTEKQLKAKLYDNALRLIKENAGKKILSNLKVFQN